MNCHASVWPLKLGDGLQRFGVACLIGVMDSHTLVRPPELGGGGSPRFGVAPRVGVMDSVEFRHTVRSDILPIFSKVVRVRSR